MLMASSMTSLYSFGQGDQNQMQQNFLVMWCHWHWHYIKSMVYDTDVSTDTKCHILPPNHHLNMIHEMFHWGHYQYHVTGNKLLPCMCKKLICPSNVTFKPPCQCSYMQIGANFIVYNLTWTHCSLFDSYGPNAINNVTRNKQCDQECWNTFISHY